VVTICTASLTFSNSTFCPHTVFMCSVWISEQTAIISLYNINWLVFITQTQCVYCAVRTGYLNTLRVSLSIYAVEYCECAMTTKQPFVTCGLLRRPVCSTHCCIMTPPHICLPHKTMDSLHKEITRTASTIWQLSADWPHNSASLCHNLTALFWCVAFGTLMKALAHARTRRRVWPTLSAKRRALVLVWNNG